MASGHRPQFLPFTFFLDVLALFKANLTAIRTKGWTTLPGSCCMTSSFPPPIGAARWRLRPSTITLPAPRTRVCPVSLTPASMDRSHTDTRTPHAHNKNHSQHHNTESRILSGPPQSPVPGLSRTIEWYGLWVDIKEGNSKLPCIPSHSPRICSSARAAPSAAAASQTS